MLNKPIMENDPLTGAEKKELRGIGQRLKPHLHIGKNGLSATASKEIDRALLKNGLIKIRFEADREVIKNYCNDIPEKPVISQRSLSKHLNISAYPFAWSSGINGCSALKLLSLRGSISLAALSFIVHEPRAIIE